MRSSIINGLAQFATALAFTSLMPAALANSFALIGDQPYQPELEAQTDELLAYLNTHSQIAWILHVGDIKGGGEPCSNALLQRRIKQLQASPKALVYVPGDNEWTDCHRESNGGHAPLERLDFVRKLAFVPSSKINAQGFKAFSQTDAGYPEHLMWVQGNALFVTLNIPGSNNNLEHPKSRKDSKAEVQREFKLRMQAVDQWLKAAEQRVLQAPANNPIEAVVVALQGNPVDGSGSGFSPSQWFGPGDGYGTFRQMTIDLAKNTKKPVLVAHGDTHRFKFDQPEWASELKLPIYRVEAWGHPFTNMWVKVNIHPQNNPPFSAESLRLPSASSAP